MDAEGFQPQPATKQFATETRQILSELGFEDERIDALVASGVTARRSCTRGILYDAAKRQGVVQA